MFRSAFVFLVALAAILPCTARAQAASESPATPGAIQAGTYDIELVVGGGTLPGTLTITAIRDSIHAKLSLGEHDPPINKIVRRGSKLTLSGTAPGINVVYELAFSGATVDGTFVFNDQSGTVTGKRRR